MADNDLTDADELERMLIKAERIARRLPDAAVSILLRRALIRVGRSSALLN